MSPARPAVPSALPLNEALRLSAPLSDLRRRLQESSECLKAIQQALPAPLLGQVRAGPVDEDGWTLLAANAAVAAKLKQLKPRLQDHLLAHTGRDRPIRIKIVQPSST